jgi:hypothetical protein
MRLWFALCCLVVLCVGCAGPHSTGALWAQQHLEREAALFKLTDAQRALQAHAFELGLADESTANERARITDELQLCPGPFQALTYSVGDRARDAIRLRAQGDATRLATVAQLALADWQLRRARATGNAQFCQKARAALTGASSFGEPSSSDLLSLLGTATVTRDPHRASAPLDTGPPSITLSNYALGYLDTVHAAAPLPQYLALVYGGFVYPASPAATMDDESAAETVDREAAAYPEWEPDALYAGLGARPNTLRTP